MTASTTRYRRKPVELQAKARNRLQRLLESCNVQLASLASDVFRKQGGRMKVIEQQPVIEKILSHLGLPHVPLPTSPARGQRPFGFFAA